MRMAFCILICEDTQELMPETGYDIPLWRWRTNGQLWTLPSRSCYASWEQLPTMGMWFPFWILPGSKHMLVGKYINYWQKCSLIEYLGHLLDLDTDRICVDTLIMNWKAKQNQGLIQEESFTYVSLKGISSIVEIKYPSDEWAGGKVESCKNPHAC